MGMNSQIHLTIETQILDRLRIEAEDLEISVAELIRRKLAKPPTDLEIIELRRLKEFFISKRSKYEKGKKINS